MLLLADMLRLTHKISDRLSAQTKSDLMTLATSRLYLAPIEKKVRRAAIGLHEIRSNTHIGKASAARQIQGAM